ncbi:MAG: tyrosine-type recombinase/integrase, partial [Polyangiaceae bacterium]
MPREATGQVLHNASGYSARVRVAPGDEGRQSFALAVRSDDEAERRTQLLASIAKRLRAVVAATEIAEVLTDAGKARTGKELAEVEDVVRSIVAGETRKASSVATPTFAKFAEQWTSGELRKNHPDHVREKDSTRDEEILRLYVNPQIGSKRIADVILDDCECVMRALPTELSPATRRHVAQCMRKVLSLAVYPGRYLTSNPIVREWMPKVPKSARKAKSCLFPADDVKLLRCRKVDLVRRLAYGILAREGMRASELERLKWQDVDLDQGRIRLDKNKTADPRAWALSPDVARTLAWWKKKSGGKADDLVLGLDLGDGAWWLRGDDKDREKYPGDLHTAGVTRPELFERSATRQPIRLHDLRATFVTVSLATGRTEQWVTDRTGHKSSQMLALYARQARTWAELELGTLHPLDELLPEMSAHRVAGASPANGKRHPRKARGATRRAARRGNDWAANGQRGVSRGGFEPPTYGLKVRS